MNERFRHCISMTKMLNSENLLADSGLDPSTTAITADRILYSYAMEQCQSAALDELFGNPGECFQVKITICSHRDINKSNIAWHMW